MKPIKLITLSLIIIAAAIASDCSKESDNNIIPGYWSPGDFRPAGIAREKSFRLSIVDAVAGTTDKTCSSGAVPTDKGRCMAVHGAWLTGISYENSFPSEGIALNDSYLGTQNMTMKIVRYIGAPWVVHLYLNGIQYSNANVTQIQMVRCVSVDETIPAYTPPSGPVLSGSGIQINLVFIRFTSNITLTATTGETQTLIQTDAAFDTSTLPGSVPASGDYILALEYL